MFGFGFAPVGWALCQGQTLPISQNTALYTLLGIAYGGDGKTTFQLPDLRGRTPFDQDFRTYATGNKGGTETISLTAAQVPPHTHLVEAIAENGNAAGPTGNFISSIKPEANGTKHNAYAAPGTLLAINPASVGASGAGAGHNNMQPFLTLNFCISLAGIYPSRQ